MPTEKNSPIGGDITITFSEEAAAEEALELI